MILGDHSPWKVVSSNRIQLIVFLILYGVAWIMADSGKNYLSGISLIVLGVFLFICNFYRTRLLIDFRGLLSLSWLCGEGLACLKLSRLAAPWSGKTWVCFGAAYMCFWIGYECFYFLKQRREKNGQECFTKISPETIMENSPDLSNNQDEVSDPMLREKDKTRKRVLISLILVTVLSLGAFLLEAFVLGYIPILSDKPHAYSYFHISGVHYFTVCFTFVPSLALIYYKVCKDNGVKVHFIAWICVAVSLILPVLCVSRFQLIFTVIMMIMTYLILYPHVKIRYAVIAVVALVPIYVILTIFRNHDVAYLNGIFEMKNSNMPIFITQPYMYVANNFENFNCLVEQLPAHTYGLRMLFPVFALTGLKFLRPELVSFPLYVTKTELTTVTWIYDFYYDFGVIGVIVFTFLIGIGCRFIKESVLKNRNPIAALFYGQIAIYISLSFFTTWFSNPTTWFWLVVTTILYVFVGWKGKKKCRMF